MPTPGSAIVDTKKFTHKGRVFVTSAFIKPGNANTIFVDVTEGNNPVVYTYPGGSQATNEHSVTVMTAFDWKRQQGTDAVEVLMDDAEKLVRRFV